MENSGEALESGWRLRFCQPPEDGLKMIAMPQTVPAGRVHRDCPSCRTPSATAAKVAYAHPDWPMVKCANCGLVYLEQVPVYDALYDELAWTKQREREEKRRLKKQPIFARIDLMTRWRMGILGEATPAGGLTAWAKPGAVLDVGCSTGKAFAELPDGYVPFGVEIEANAARPNSVKGTYINSCTLSATMSPPVRVDVREFATH